jgi:O-antigen ligase
VSATASVPPRTSPLLAVLTALATAGGLIAMGVANGSYDIVPRQTAGLILWWCVGLGAVVLLRPPRAGSIPSVLTVGFALAMVGWIALHVSDSISVERSATELVRDLTHVAPLLLVGWVLPRSLWRPVVIGVALAGVVLCAVALASRLDPGFLADRRFIIFRNTNERLSSPMGYWNAVGLTAAITVLLLLAIAAHAPRAIWRGVALAGAPVCIAAAYLTYSRSPLGAAALGAVVLFATSRNRITFLAQAAATALAGALVIAAIRGQEQIALGTGAAGRGAVLIALVLASLGVGLVGAATGRFGIDRLRMARRPATIATIASVVVALIVGIVAINRYGDDAWQSFKTPEQGGGYVDPSKRLTTLNTTRVQQWEKALEAWRDEPGAGYGAGTFELIYNQRQDQGEFVRDAHNAYVETLAEQGTIGLLLLLGFLASAAAAIGLAIRRARSDLDRGLLAGVAAVFAAFVLGTGVDWFWEVTSIPMMVLALVGAALAAAARPDDDAARARRIPGWAMRGGVVALALLAVLAELPGLVGMSEERRSARAVAAGDLERARDHADRAIDVLPWASSPFLQRALVDEQAGAWPSALRAMELAERRDPQDWRLPLVTARIEAKAGNAEEALAAYRRAKELRPYGSFFR